MWPGRWGCSWGGRGWRAARLQRSGRRTVGNTAPVAASDHVLASIGTRTRPLTYTNRFSHLRLVPQSGFGPHSLPAGSVRSNSPCFTALEFVRGGARSAAVGVGSSSAVKNSEAHTSLSSDSPSGWSRIVSSKTQRSFSNSSVNVHRLGRISSSGDDLRPAGLSLGDYIESYPHPESADYTVTVSSLNLATRYSCGLSPLMRLQ